MTPEQEEQDDLRYIYVKLNNGDNILCATTEQIDNLEGDFLRVVDPIQIMSMKVPYKGMIVEKFMMQSWVPFSEADVVNIPLQHVIFIGDLKEPFITKYIEYVESQEEDDPYGMEADESLLAEIEDHDLDEDDLEAFLEESEQSKQPAKKWLH